MAMEQDRTVIGIDLGTTNSCVGIWRNGGVEIIANDQGNRTTPSCVAFTDSERLVGEGANHQVASNASNTVFDVKRLMGRSFCDASVARDAKYWPFGMMQGPDDKPLIRVSYLGEEKNLSPEEISAMVLVKMKETAEAYVGRPITDAVITVPAYFNGSQRQATKDAGAIAGLNVLRIINEPTAAALAYALNTSWRESTVLVYDLGGGTLDVSVIAINRDGLKVMATAGDTHLGGEDFTNNMVDHFVEEFKRKNANIMGDISDDKKALGRLRRSCEVAKKKLSTNPRIPVEVYALFEGIDFYSEITRQQFEKLNGDLFRRCMEPVEKCLMGNIKVDDVVLVGACTRIPLLHQLVKDFFNGREPCRIVNADEAVACGATAQAAILTLTGSIPTEVLDITPFSLGISTPDGVMWEVVERYTAIPTRKETPPFVRVNDDQNSMEITVYEDGRAMADKFSIPLQHPKNKVLYEIDQDGILQVSVWEQEGWKTFTNLLVLGRFSKEEMERVVKDTQKYKDQDEKHKKYVQARNDIQNLLFTISNNMKNIEDSAARLLVHQEATQEQDLQTPGHQDTSIQVYKPHKARDKDNREMIQAHTDTINKLQNNIKQLQDTADGTTKLLESKELTTHQIIGKMEQIQGDYNSISSQIENIQARDNLQNFLFTISHNIKNLEDSAARFLIHPEASREQDLQTPGFEDKRARNSTRPVYMPQKIQDKDTMKMVQAHNDTINKLQHSIKQLQGTAYGAAKFLENRELTTNQIIGHMKLIEGHYNNISSQIENIQARNNILHLLFTIRNNRKNLEDSAARFFIHPEETRAQDLQTPGYQDTRGRNSTRPVYLPHKVQDNDTRKMVQAHNDTINQLQHSIKQLQGTADGTTKLLENKELTTNQIIGQMKQIEGHYNNINSQIENIQARNNILHLLFTVRNNMKNLEDSAAILFIHPKATRAQDLQTPRYQDTRARNSTIPVYLPHKVQDKDNGRMVQTHNDSINQLQQSIKQLQGTVDGTTKLLGNKELTTNQIVGQMKQIEGHYNSITSHIENLQARNDLQNLLVSIRNNMKNLEDSAARFLIHLEANREHDLQTPGIEGTRARNSTRPVYMPHKVQDKDTKKKVQAHNDTIDQLHYSIKHLQETADETTKLLENKELTTNQIIGQRKQIEGHYNSISSQIENIQARNDLQNFLLNISSNMKNLEASAATLCILLEATQEQDLHTPEYQDTRTRNSTGQVYKPYKPQDMENMKMLEALNDTVKKLQDSIQLLQDTADGLTTNQIIGQMKQIEGDYNSISNQLENIQARNEIQTLVFTIRNNMKNLEASARRLLVHPEETQEQIIQTLQEVASSWTSRFRTQKGQDKDNKKMIQAQNDTIKELQNSIKKLQEKVDLNTEWLENKELTTNQIIDRRDQIEGDYNNICRQIESASKIDSVSH